MTYGGRYIGGTTHLPIPTEERGQDVAPDTYGRNRRFVPGSIIRLSEAPASPPTPCAPKPCKAPKARTPKMRRKPKPKPPPKPRGPKVDVAEIVRRYTAGQTVPAIAAETGHSRGTVRTHLKASGVPIRDDRAGHSGGRNRIDAYPADLVAEIRNRYEQGYTQAHVAARLGITQKVVQSVMARHGIQARPAAHIKRSAT